MSSKNPKMLIKFLSLLTPALLLQSKFVVTFSTGVAKAFAGVTNRYEERAC